MKTITNLSICESVLAGLGFRFGFNIGVFAIIVAAHNANCVKCIWSLLWARTKSIIEVLLTGSLSHYARSSVFGGGGGEPNQKNQIFIFFFLTFSLATILKKIGKSGNCCGCFIISIINKHCSTEVKKNKHQQLLLPWKNSDKHKYLYPFDSSEAKRSFSNFASFSPNILIWNVLLILHLAEPHDTKSCLLISYTEEMAMNLYSQERQWSLLP